MTVSKAEMGDIVARSHISVTIFIVINSSLICYSSLICLFLHFNEINIYNIIKHCNPMICFKMAEKPLIDGLLTMLSQKESLLTVAFSGQ